MQKIVRCKFESMTNLHNGIGHMYVVSKDGDLIDIELTPSIYHHIVIRSTEAIAKYYEDQQKVESGEQQ